MHQLARLTLLAFVTGMASGRGLAQGRVWIVDQQNGAGANFTDMPPAVAAATDGDLIRVRAGTYSPVTTNKALTIQRQNGSTVPQLRSLTVQDLPAGRLFVVQGLVLGALPIPPTGSALILSNCAGRIVLDRVTLSTGTIPATITACLNVQINDSTLRGGTITFPVGRPPLHIDNAHVALTSCQIVGPPGNPFIGVGAPGFTATGAVVSLARSVVTGGEAVNWAGGPTQPGIVLDNTRITISGDSTSRVAAGAANLGAAPTSAIVLTGGGLTIDPAVTLQSNSAPTIAATNATVTFVPLPSLRATGAVPGGIVSADVFSSVGDLVVFLTGLPGDALPVGLGEDLWIDPGLVIVLGVAVQGASRHATSSLSIPNDPNLSFGAWTQQAVSGTASGFRLSNPASYSVN